MNLCQSKVFGKEHNCRERYDDVYELECQLCDGYYAPDYDWVECDEENAGPGDDRCDVCGDNSKQLIFKKNGNGLRCFNKCQDNK